MTYINETGLTASQTFDWVNGNNSSGIGDQVLNGQGMSNFGFMIGTDVNSGSLAAGDKIVLEGVIDEMPAILDTTELSETTNASDRFLLSVTKNVRAARLRLVIASGGLDIDLKAEFIKIA